MNLQMHIYEYVQSHIVYIKEYLYNELTNAYL